MPVTPVNLVSLKRTFDAQVLQGIKYRLGGKAPSLKSKPSELESGIDCSGEIRLLLFQATDGALAIPDGSWNQRKWCEDNLQEVPYSEALSPDSNDLYIAFITAKTNGAGTVGHVWLITQRDADAMGETMESYGGHGIGSRSASYGTLVRLVHKCFKVPTVEEIAAKAGKPEMVKPISPAPKPVTSPLALNVNGTVRNVKTVDKPGDRFRADVVEVIAAMGRDYARNDELSTSDRTVLNVFEKV